VGGEGGRENLLLGVPHASVEHVHDQVRRLISVDSSAFGLFRIVENKATGPPTEREREKERESAREKEKERATGAPCGRTRWLSVGGLRVGFGVRGSGFPRRINPG